MNNDLKIILGDYASLLQSDRIEIKGNEAICFITLKRSIIFCPICGRRMNIKDHRKCKISHNMIRGKNTTILFKKKKAVLNAITQKQRRIPSLKIAEEDYLGFLRCK